MTRGAPARARPVYFLLRRDFLLLDLSAVVEPLRLANECAGRALFDFHFVAQAPGLRSSVSLGVGPIAPLPARLPDDALVVVPGTRSATLDENRALQPPAIAWLRAVVRPSHLVLCVCSGALLAAQAGLLDGRTCTTHHDFCARLAREHPKAKVQDNRIFVRDGNVFTSAGVTAGLDLTLFVLEQLHGESLALAVARQLVVYFRRSGEDPQLSPLLAHRNHLHPLVHQVQDAVLRDCTVTWSLATLARLVHVSPRQLTRLFERCAGTTPAAYVALVRAARARELLDTTALSVDEVAERAGFGSTRQLRRVFARQFGAPPRRWRTTLSAAG